MGARDRRRFLATAGGLTSAVTAGCLSFAFGGAAPDPDGAPTVPRGEDSDRFFNHDVSLSYDYGDAADAAESGGVGQDGIPSIDNPEFGGPAVGHDNMDPGDPVFGVVLEGQARAYPQYIPLSVPSVAPLLFFGLNGVSHHKATSE